MRCPKCGANNDRVIDSRTAQEADTIRRRRECLSCGTRFTSYERIERHMPRIIKRDGHREEFDRKKIERGLDSACRKRGISQERIAALIDDVMAELDRQQKPEVPSTLIGQALMERLAALDPVAYVRFASVYSAFNDVNQFIETVRGLTPKRISRRRNRRPRDGGDSAPPPGAS